MSGNRNIAIKVTGVSKSFKLPHEKQDSIKGKLINFRKRGFEVQQALDEVTFQIEKGDFFGIVGRNGSGKSTLLKLIAGIYKPDKGDIMVDGHLTPFIELGVGFNFELSGRDNVFLNGALLGFTRKDMEAMYDDIVGFAGLERFMDQKLKNYSSGMQVRLAFSIAIRADSDILLLDEVLAVGDSAFQQKCFDYFRELKSKHKTVILVTHSMDSVEKFCDKALLLNDGVVITKGEVEEVIDSYNLLNIQQMNAKEGKLNNTSKAIKEASITNIQTVDIDNKPTTGYGPGSKIRIKLSIKASKACKNMRVAVRFNKPGGQTVAYTNTFAHGTVINANAGQSLDLTWELPNIFADGNYLISASVSNQDNTRIYDRKPEAVQFDVFGQRTVDGVVSVPDKLELRFVD